MTELLQYIWPITVLVIFGGMLALCFRALAIAHDLASIVLQSGLTPQVKAVVPSPTPPAPAKPTPTLPGPPISTQPVDVVDAGLITFIKKQEGFRTTAYWDYKQYSIGYGTKANSATEVIDEKEAEARLTIEIDKAWQAVEKVLPPGTPIGIKQALTDLTYNAGPGWEEASLGAAVKAGHWDTVKADILQYNHAGGKVLDALTKRREAEVSWFDNPL